MPVYEQVEQAPQDILAPELQALKVEITRLDEKIDTRFDGIRAEIEARFESARGEISSIHNEINS
ncbi:MAG: hypothetical protein ACUVQS_04315 [Candidatus Bipolaricaulaceae bacterium]